MYRRLFLVTRSFDKPIPVLRSQLSVEIRSLEEQELPAYRVFRPAQRVDMIRARLAAGHRCHASWHEGRIVDAAWCAMGRGPVPYFWRDLVVGAGDVFIYDAYTLPGHRGHNLFMAKFAHIFRTCRDEGHTRNTGVVAIENRASLTVLRRLGCEKIGLYASVGLGPCRIIWQHPFGDEPLPLMTR